MDLTNLAAVVPVVGEQTSSVELSTTAQGTTTVTVKVYDRDPPWPPTAPPRSMTPCAPATRTPTHALDRGADPSGAGHRQPCLGGHHRPLPARAADR
jgi:hypothetical protein